MPKQSALRLVDAIADETRRGGGASPELRAQVAFIRALVDEAERHDPADRWVPALHDQLAEELSRLGQLVKRGSGTVAAEVETGPLGVLVVEDDEQTQRVMVSALRDLGYPCRAAGDAESALCAFDADPAAIVITDWSLPGTSGLDLCAALKERDPEPYVLLVTAHDADARLREHGRGWVDDFLGKPVDLDDLEARLAAASRFIRALRSVAALNASLGEQHGAASYA